MLYHIRTRLYKCTKKLFLGNYLMFDNVQYMRSRLLLPVILFVISNITVKAVDERARVTLRCYFCKNI